VAVGHRFLRHGWMGSSLGTRRTPDTNLMAEKTGPPAGFVCRPSFSSASSRSRHLTNRQRVADLPPRIVITTNGSSFGSGAYCSSSRPMRRTTDFIPFRARLEAQKAMPVLPFHDSQVHNYTRLAMVSHRRAVGRAAPPTDTFCLEGGQRRLASVYELQERGCTEAAPDGYFMR
jgi:hypothetical protein